MKVVAKNSIITYSIEDTVYLMRINEDCFKNEIYSQLPNEAVIIHIKPPLTEEYENDENY